MLWWSAAGIAQAAGQTPDRTMVGVQDLAWSADGERLFFSAMRVKPDYSDYTPEKWAVYSYTLATRELKLVAPAAFSVNTAPRGSRIVLGKLIDGNRDLLVLEGDGREVARLTDHPAEDYGGAWSPDGRHIAFTSKRNGHSEVFVANADGSDPRRLVDAGAARTFSPSWSADGQYIAYYREIGDGQDQIHVVRADGSGDRNLDPGRLQQRVPGLDA